MAVAGSQFNWSLLDREWIFTYIWLLAPDIVNKQVPVDQLYKLISRHLKIYIPLRITKQHDPTIIPNMLLIGGRYYRDKDKNLQRSVELNLLYNPNDEYLKINKLGFCKICYAIADTILHEIIHMRQYRRRNFKYIPGYVSTELKNEKRLTQVYLGCADEIDAYGFSIACELMDQFNGNQCYLRAYLGASQRGSRTQFNSWKMYLEAFDHEHEHVVIKRLKKTVLRYLPHAIIGKPYRNKNWISY